MGRWKPRRSQANTVILALAQPRGSLAQVPESLELHVYQGLKVPSTVSDTFWKFKNSLSTPYHTSFPGQSVLKAWGSHCGTSGIDGVSVASGHRFNTGLIPGPARGLRIQDCHSSGIGHNCSLDLSDPWTRNSICCRATKKKKKKKKKISPKKTKKKQEKKLFPSAPELRKGKFVLIFSSMCVWILDDLKHC